MNKLKKLNFVVFTIVSLVVCAGCSISNSGPDFYFASHSEANTAEFVVHSLDKQYAVKWNTNIAPFDGEVRVTSPRVSSQETDPLRSVIRLHSDLIVVNVELRDPTIHGRIGTSIFKPWPRVDGLFVELALLAKSEDAAREFWTEQNLTKLLADGLRIDASDPTTIEGAPGFQLIFSEVSLNSVIDGFFKYRQFESRTVSSQKVDSAEIVLWPDSRNIPASAIRTTVATMQNALNDESKKRNSVKISPVQLKFNGTFDLFSGSRVKVPESFADRRCC